MIITVILPLYKIYFLNQNFDLKILKINTKMNGEENRKHYIYIIREREFIRLNEPTYKIGRTSQLPDDRFNGYPKQSEIILYTAVEDPQAAERKLMSVFKNKFERKKGYGNEYFNGDINEMITLVYSTLYNNKDKAEISSLKNKINQLVIETECVKEQNKVLSEKLKWFESFRTTFSNFFSPPTIQKEEPSEEIEMIDQELLDRLNSLYKYSKSTEKYELMENIYSKIKETGYKTTQNNIIKALSTLGKVGYKKIGDKNIRVVGIAEH
jgi:hypothetical protein